MFVSSSCFQWIMVVMGVVVVVCGDPGVGKTQLVNRFINNSFNQVKGIHQKRLFHTFKACLRFILKRCIENRLIPYKSMCNERRKKHFNDWNNRFGCLSYFLLFSIFYFFFLFSVIMHVFDHWGSKQVIVTKKKQKCVVKHNFDWKI